MNGSLEMLQQDLLQAFMILTQQSQREDGLVESQPHTPRIFIHYLRSLFIWVFAIILWWLVNRNSFVC